MSLIGALPNPIFMPAMRDIAAITNAFPALVTTTFNHGYITGSIVRLYVPLNFGMNQANWLTGSIIVTSSTQFTINVDTSSFDPFVIPVPAPNQPAFTPAQVTPIGEDTDTFASSFMNIITPIN